MKIIELTLHRYKRLFLGGIETIRYTPEDEIQIIIGSNGSGKSSLLDELTPFPPDKNSMLSGGYKDIMIEHEKHIYHLKSIYTDKGNGKHYFECDGVILNDGGTASAQKTLIEKHFNINSEIMDLWIGRTTFTSMPPTKRRDWIIKLSGSDLDFAMKLYSKLKSESRDAQGVVKHYAKRLAEESADINDKSRIEMLEKEIKRLTEELTAILSSKEQNVPSIESIKFEIEILMREFEQQSAEVLTLNLVKPSCLSNVNNNLHAVESYLNNIGSSLAVAEEQLSRAYKEKDNVLNTYELMAANGVNEIDELKGANKVLEKELKSRINQNGLFSKIEQVEIGELIGTYKTVKPMLIELLSTMFDNSEMFYTNEVVKTRRAEHEELVKKLEKFIQSRVKLLAHIELHMQTDTVECPSCKHTFKPGLISASLDALNNKLAGMNEIIEGLQKQEKELNIYLTGATEYSNQLKTVRRIMNENPILSPLWDLLAEENLFKVSPISHCPTIENFIITLEECYEIKELQKRFNDNNKLLDGLKNNGSAVDILSNTYIQQLEDRIQTNLSTIDDLRVKYNDISKYLKEMSKAEKSYKRCLEIKNTLIEKHDLLLNAIKNKAIGELVNSKQIELAHASTNLNNIARHEAAVQEITKEKAKADIKVKDYEVLEKVLSPVDGLISKYIQNFIDVFIGDMNDIIGNIWTYPLEILSCGVDSNDVNCKFPLSIENGYLYTQDISQGSAGQQDIINFAFKLIMGRYLGMKDFPLYLDELAPTLDEKHRFNLIKFLTLVMESGEFNQMFMISHYSSNHFAFANAEYLMLDGRNITNKPKDYNLNAEIIYQTLED